MNPGRIRSVLPSCWSIETRHGRRADDPARAQRDATAMVVRDLRGGHILGTDMATGGPFHDGVGGRTGDLTERRFAAPIPHDDLPSSPAEAATGARRAQHALLRARVVTRLAALAPPYAPR